MDKQNQSQSVTYRKTLVIPKSKICLIKFSSIERPAAVVSSRAELL